MPLSRRKPREKDAPATLGGNPQQPKPKAPVIWGAIWRASKPGLKKAGSWAWRSKNGEARLKKILKNSYVQSAGAGVIIYNFPGTTIKLLLTGTGMVLSVPNVAIPAAIGAGTYHYLRKPERRQKVWELVKKGGRLGLEQIKGVFYVTGSDGTKKFMWPMQEKVVSAAKKYTEKYRERKSLRKRGQAILRASETSEVLNLIGVSRKQLDDIEARYISQAVSKNGRVEDYGGRKMGQEINGIKAGFRQVFRELTGIELTDTEITRFLGY